MEEDKQVGHEVQIACEKCDVSTYHRVLKSISESSEDVFGNEWASYQVVMCQGCRTISFRKHWGTDEVIGVDDDGDPVYESSQAVYPSRAGGRKPLRYAHALPSAVSEIYAETHKAVCGEQPILAGLGIRTIVEAVCVEKKVGGHNLKKKIDNLVNTGVLTKEGAEILHNAREYGNDAAHETNKTSASDLGILMDIVENLLQNTYILPGRAAKLHRKYVTKK